MKKKYITLLTAITIAFLATIIYRESEIKSDSEVPLSSIDTIVIGDSISSGMMDESGVWATNYVYNLNKKIKNYYLHFVGDYSFGGMSVERINSYGGYCLNTPPGKCLSDSNENENHSIEKIFKQYIKGKKTGSLIIIQGGINDINSIDRNPESDPGISAVRFIKEVAKAYPHAKIAFINVQALNTSDKQNDLIIKFNREVKKYLLSKGYIFIDCSPMLKKENYIDNLHPNKKGYEEMREIISSSLNKYLKGGFKNE